MPSATTTEWLRRERWSKTVQWIPCKVSKVWMSQARSWHKAFVHTRFLVITSAALRASIGRIGLHGNEWVANRKSIGLNHGKGLWVGTDYTTGCLQIARPCEGGRGELQR